MKDLGNSVPAAAGKQKDQTFVMMTRRIGLVDGVWTNWCKKLEWRNKSHQSWIGTLEEIIGCENFLSEEWNLTIQKGILISESIQPMFTWRWWMKAWGVKRSS